MTFRNDTKIVYSLRYDFEDRYIAAGYSQGTIKVFNIQTGKESNQLNATSISETDKLPFMSLRWRPEFSGKNLKLLTAVSVDGRIYQWNIPSGKLLNLIKPQNSNQELYCMDYNKSGTLFGVGGKEDSIRIFDESTKKESQIFSNECIKNPGHSNRIFSIKFTDDPNLIISSGWDKTIKVWDLRKNDPVTSIVGVDISGDCLESIGHLIICGNHRSKNSIQIWSLQNFNLLETLEPKASTLIYSLRLSQNGGKYLIAGGYRDNEVKILERNNPDSFVCKLSNFTEPNYCVDISRSLNHFAFGTGDGKVRIFDMMNLQEARQNK